MSFCCRDVSRRLSPSTFATKGCHPMSKNTEDTEAIPAFMCCNTYIFFNYRSNYDEEKKLFLAHATLYSFLMNTESKLQIVLVEWRHIEVVNKIREKGRDLTQSCDKIPYTHRTIQKATWQHNNATKNYDYATIADRLRTVSWSNSSHPTRVVKPVYERSTFPLTATAV